MESGVYVIENSVTGKVYVGSAVDFAARWKGHLARLRKRNHHSIKLQRSFDRHGEAAFVFRVVLVCAPVNLLMYEQIVMDFHCAAKVGYNMTPTAGSLLGHKTGPESAARRSAAMKGKTLGRKLSEEHKRKISDGLRNSARVWAHGPAARAKIGEVQRGRIQSAATVAKRAAAISGQKRSQDQIDNMRKAQSVRMPVTVETRQRMAEAAKRVHEQKRAAGIKQVITPAMREKLLAAQRAKPMTDATRAKMRAAQLARTDLERDDTTGRFMAKAAV
jgi:group I intron endonuclease